MAADDTDNILTSGDDSAAPIECSECNTYVTDRKFWIVTNDHGNYNMCEKCWRIYCAKKAANFKRKRAVVGRDV